MTDNISAIVYTSGTGFTRRYAQLLGEQTGLPIYDIKAPGGPAKGVPVLYLGWLCAGTLKGLKTALSRWSVRAVCAVGLGTEESNRPERLAPTLHLPDGASLFYLRGGFAPEAQKGPMKLVIGMMRKGLEDKPPEDADGRVMLEAFRDGDDWVRAENLEPVLTYLNGGGV